MVSEARREENRRTDREEDAEFFANVVALHTCGPEALYEMLDRLGAEYMLRTPIERLVRQFAHGKMP